MRKENSGIAKKMMEEEEYLNIERKAQKKVKKSQKSEEIYQELRKEALRYKENTIGSEKEGELSSIQNFLSLCQ